MPAKPVPQRGDGFDTNPSKQDSSLQGSVESTGSSLPVQLRGMDFSKMDIAAIAAALGTDEKNAAIVKNVASGGLAGLGAIGGLKLNQMFGGHIPEELAAFIGGGAGAAAGIMLSKALMGDKVSGAKKKRRKY